MIPRNRIWMILGIIVAVLVLFGGYVVFTYCTSNPHNARTIGDLPLPMGYRRVPAEKGSVGEFMRSLPLRPRGTKVHLYKSRRLANYQWLSAGVVDLPLLSSDEQCADVCMRMRAEYLFSTRQYGKISFTTLSGTKLTYSGGNNRKAFERFMRSVYGACNTTSLHRSLKTRDLSNMQIGDIFVFPHRKIAGKDRYGHAVIVADMAVNRITGRKIFLLIEGNTPARDIHVLRNLHPLHNPWFYLNDDASAFWLNVFRFDSSDLKHF